MLIQNTMEYIKVRWIHDHEDEPILLYSELDHDRFELRKVEVYEDGSAGWASSEVGISSNYNADIQVYKVPLITA